MNRHAGVEKARAFFAGGLGKRQALSLETRRGNVDRLGEMASVPDVVTRQRSRLGECPVEIVTTERSGPGHAILYLHGGAFVAGSALSHAHVSAMLATETDIPVYVLEYRLAPEHPFPAGLNDVIKAYHQILTEVGDSTRISLVGDSAGGNLTLSALCRLRDAGTDLPSSGVAISPSTDLTCGGESYDTRKEQDFFLSREGLETDFATYLAGTSAEDPGASPLFGDLTGLPPLLLQVGSDELLLSDSTRFADKAKAAGGDVTLEIWEEMIHVWHLFPQWLPEARQAIKRIAAFINKTMAG